MARPRQPSAPATRQANSNASTIQHIQTSSQVYEGPIPHPEILRQFDALVPGTAERLITLAEEESRHRRALENRAQEANVAAQQRQIGIGEYQSHAVFRSDIVGQAFGLTVCLACIAGAVFVGLQGHEWTAAALAAIPTAAVIRAFVLQRKPQSDPPKP